MTYLADVGPYGFLRRVLLADAATCVAAGLLMLGGAGFLTGWLGVPPALMRYAGLSLLPFAALLVYVATRAYPPRAMVWAVIAWNAVWALDSIALIFTGWIAPTPLGIAFIVAQALAAAAFAALEYLGLRRSAAVA
jgi:hypothetical protein